MRVIIPPSDHQILNKILSDLYSCDIDPLLFEVKSTPTARIKTSYIRSVNLIRRTIKWIDRKKETQKKEGSTGDKYNWKSSKMNIVPSNIS